MRDCEMGVLTRNRIFAPSVPQATVTVPDPCVTTTISVNVTTIVMTVQKCGDTAET